MKRNSTSGQHRYPRITTLLVDIKLRLSLSAEGANKTDVKQPESVVHLGID